MTTRFRRAVLLSLLCLTVYATSASAECAWVLWKAVDKQPGNTAISGDVGKELFFVVAAYTGSKAHDACNRDGSSLYLQAMQKNESWSYLCLPDTVGPRGPKGK